MIQALKRKLLQAVKALIYGQWPERVALEHGYTMLLPIPADMPFLLRFALKGLGHLRIPNCKRILVIPDGAISDQAIRAIVTEFSDKRVQFVPLAATDKVIVGLPFGHYRHFVQILRGVLAATTDAIYLHDADAFWLEVDGVETQYQEFRDRGMYTLGVTSRIDAMFREQGFEIPGTWELMFSSSWVRMRPPIEMKNGWYPLLDGQWHKFDTLLFGQYSDYASGKIGVMSHPPRFVHFYGTIVGYRRWQRTRRAGPVEDELFSLLLLSVLAEAMPGPQRETELPRPSELAQGLHDPAAKITYRSNTAPKRYASFRRGITELCSGRIFDQDVSRRIEELIAPFDEHFGISPEKRGTGDQNSAQMASAVR